MPPLLMELLKKKKKIKVFFYLRLRLFFFYQFSLFLFFQYLNFDTTVKWIFDEFLFTFVKFPTTHKPQEAPTWTLTIKEMYLL